MTDRNSPGLTPNETSSTATTGPSDVSKRTTMSSTFRMASFNGLEGEGDMDYSLLRVMAAVVAAV